MNTNSNTSGKRGRVASAQPSLIKFQTALREDGALPAWITSTPGGIDAKTHFRTPTLYHSPAVARVSADGLTVEIVRFVAEEHKAAKVEVIATATVEKFIAWAKKQPKALPVEVSAEQPVEATK